jgi:predicted acetyltransferase
VSEIRVLTEEEYPEMIRIVLEAYPSEVTDPGRSMEEEVEQEKKFSRDTSYKVYGVFRDGKMVGVFRNFDFSLNVRGNMVPTGGLGMVAVDLTHKKEHVAYDIVDFFLKHNDERGDPMTMLWPFRVDFYHKMGFGLGSTMHRYSVRPADLPLGPSREHIRFLGEDDIPAVCECYNRVVEKQCGMVKHPEARYLNRMEYAKKLKWIGCEIDGKLEGLLFFKFGKPEHQESFMDNELVVAELLYHTPEALSEILAFLHTQLDQCGRITLHTSEDEFYFTMANPTLASNRVLSPTYHESHMTGVGIMYRVMDIPRLFESLTKPCFGDDTLSVKVTLTDSFFPKNAGSKIIRFENGLGTVYDSGDSDVEISLDISEFSSMVMGSAHFKNLVTYGLARISDDALTDRVDNLFAYHQKPICYSGF